MAYLALTSSDYTEDHKVSSLYNAAHEDEEKMGES